MIESIPKEDRIRIAKTVLDRIWDEMVENVLPEGAIELEREWITMVNHFKLEELGKQFPIIEEDNVVYKPRGNRRRPDKTYVYRAYVRVNGKITEIRNDAWDDKGEQVLRIVWQMPHDPHPWVTLMDRSGRDIS